MITPEGEEKVIRGEFYTDGETYVFTLAGTPLSGTGRSADAAFTDLMRTDAEAGELGARLKDLAREQAGETTRRAVIRAAVAILLVFGVVGGALAGAVAMAPLAMRALADSTDARLAAWAETLSPEAKTRLSRVLQGSGTPAAAQRQPAAPKS